jgi:predicted permease
MLNVIGTIVPVFAIIFLGWLIRQRHLIQHDLLDPANRLVYYVAVPALIFREISGASFDAQFNPTVLTCTLVPVLVVFALAVAFGLSARIPRAGLGTFVQSSFHGNLGYIGLAVAYYYLGNDGLVRAGILVGFVMLLQNFLAVIGLQLGSLGVKGLLDLRLVVRRVVGNPVVVSALVGIVFSAWGIRVPVVIDRTLKILGGMALPLALLVIGASLSFNVIRAHIAGAAGAGFLKLIALPGVGYLLYVWAGLSPVDYLPGLILLAAPTATLTYVMATEMGGDTELAVAAISLNTLLSAVTFVLWLGVAG